MTEKPSAKSTNSEIVKALIVLTQDFFNHSQRPGLPPDQMPFNVTIDEGNLMDRISMALNAHRRQQDRITDILDSMKKVVEGR